MTIDASKRRTVRRRARNRCEYCLMPQSAVDIRLHVEHIVARQHRGDDSLANLARLGGFSYAPGCSKRALGEARYGA